MSIHDVGSDYSGKRTDKIPLLFGSTDISSSCTIRGRGHIHSAVLTLPNFTNVVTGLMTLVNPDSDEVYRSASFVKNDTHKIKGIDESQVETLIATVTLSGVPGSAGTAYLTVYYEQRG